MRLVVLSSEESFALGEQPLVVGSSESCDVRIAGAAPGHVHVAQDAIEALAECVVGKVRLAPKERRLVVPECLIELGDAKLLLRDEAKPPPTSVPTRELAVRMLGGGAASDDLLPSVLVVQGTSAGKSRTLKTDHALTVGRAPTCQLSIEDDGGISRAHVEIAVENGVVLICDLGSTQGTFLGARRLEPNRRAVWEPDTMLRLGETTVLALRIPDWIRTTTNDFVRNERGEIDEAKTKDPENAPVPSKEPASDRTVPLESGTSAAIAFVPPEQVSTVPASSGKRHASVSERMIAAVAILAILFGLGMLVWILR